MKFGGKVIGILVIVVTLLVTFMGVQYTQRLSDERDAAVGQLVTLPSHANCKYDATTCPQGDSSNIVLPDISGIGLLLLGVILGIYLIRSDAVQRDILRELGNSKNQLSGSERSELIMSVLTADEKRIVIAVKEQPGISQATLRLRTDMSKAKLSITLKELETRGIITKIEDGKTNAVHLKREL